MDATGTNSVGVGVPAGRSIGNGSYIPEEAWLDTISASGLRRTQEQLEALGFQFKAEPSIVEEVKPCNHPVLTDPYANELRPRWAWWHRVLGGVRP